MKPKFKVNAKKRKRVAKKLMKLLSENEDLIYIMSIKWVSIEELKKLYGRQQ